MARTEGGGAGKHCAWGHCAWGHCVPFGWGRLVRRSAIMTTMRGGRLAAAPRAGYACGESAPGEVSRLLVWVTGAVTHLWVG